MSDCRPAIGRVSVPKSMSNKTQIKAGKSFFFVLLTSVITERT
jgi:hypothetical protein